MAVDLSKNGVALMAAYDDVLDAKSNTNWVLFTYEGNSNSIRLAEKGEGGLEEMVEELSSGKVMYAFCRVLDPNSGLIKYVLINWTGEGVKGPRKGICANHVRSMANFLKGAHLTINARGDDDVEPESIMGKVGKASGADFRFNKETQQGYGNAPAGPVGSVYQKTNAKDDIERNNKENQQAYSMAPTGPVGSVYQKTNAKDDIQRTNNDNQQAYSMVPTGPVGSVYQKTNAKDDIQRTNKENQQAYVPTGPVGSVYQKTNAKDEIGRTDKEKFWAQDQRDEAARKSQVSKLATENMQQVEKDRKEQDEKQSAERAKMAKERAGQIDKQRAFEKRQESEEAKLQQDMGQNDTPKKGIKFAASVQKANEAKGLISQRSFNPKDVFQQRGPDAVVSDGQPPVASRPGKLKSPFLSQSRTESETAPKPKSPPITDNPPVTEAPPTVRDASPVAPPILPVRSESPVAAAPSPVLPDVSTSPVPDVYASLVQTPALPDVYASLVQTPALPDVSTSPVQTPDVATSPDQTAASAEDDYWSDDFDDDEEEEPTSYNVSDPQQSAGQEETAPPSVPEEEDLYENVYEEPPAVEEHAAVEDGAGEDHGTFSARALYDYQAADDTEINFDPDDIITGIEKVDEGWWRGYAPDGHYGMFPANYVEVV